MFSFEAIDQRVCTRLWGLSRKTGETVKGSQVPQKAEGTIEPYPKINQNTWSPTIQTNRFWTVSPADNIVQSIAKKPHKLARYQPFRMTLTGLYKLTSKHISNMCLNLQACKLLNWFKKNVCLIFTVVNHLSSCWFDTVYNCSQTWSPVLCNAVLLCFTNLVFQWH